MNFLEKKRKPKKGFGFIYMYTSPSNKKYIGQTCRSLSERAGNLKGDGYKNCSIFYRAILKYGFDNFSVQILEELPLEQLDEKEKDYIKKYNSLVPNGYNIKQGGKNDYQKRKSREKRVCQYSLEGKLIKTYNSLAEAAADNDLTWQRVSSVCHHKRKQDKNFIYRFYDDITEITAEKDWKKLGRLTAKLNEKGEILEIYPSASQAAQSLGKQSSFGRNIRSVCEGKRKHAGGFRWKYLD